MGALSRPQLLRRTPGKIPQAPGAENLGQEVRSVRQRAPETTQARFTGRLVPVRAPGTRTLRGGLLVVDDDLTVAHRYFLARIVAHVNVMALAIQHVHHFVTGGLLVSVIHRDAALLRGRVGVALLHLLRDLVSGIAARGRAGRSGQDPGVAAADPAAEQSAHHGSDARADQPVLVFDRLRVGDLLVMTLLAWCLDRLG